MYHTVGRDDVTASLMWYPKDMYPKSSVALRLNFAGRALWERKPWASGP